MATSRWTFMRTAAVVAIVANLAGGIWWASKNPEQFRELSGVVKTVWLAFAAFVAFFGIRSGAKKERAWSDVFRKPPVQALTWTFTLFSLGALVGATESHQLEIRPDTAGTRAEFALRLVERSAGSRGDTTPVIVRDLWLARVRRGRYTAYMRPRRFRADSLSFDVGFAEGLIGRKRVAVADALRPLMGRLRLSGQPDGIELTIRAETLSAPLRRSAVRGEDPLRLDVEPGRYWIVGRAERHLSDSQIVEVFPDSERVTSITLGRAPVGGGGGGGGTRVNTDARRLQGTLVLNVRPAGLEILVNGRLQGERTPATLSLPAGSYAVVLRRRASESLADRFGYFFSQQLDLAAGQRREITDALAPRPMPLLRVEDDEPGARYVLIDVGGEREIDWAQFPRGIYLLPGRYTLRRERGGTSTTRTIDLSSDQTVSFQRGG